MDVHPTKNVSIGIDPYPSIIYGTSGPCAKVQSRTMVVSTPLKNMKVSWDGMMKFPIYGKIKNVPNHQAAAMSCLKCNVVKSNCT